MIIFIWWKKFWIKIKFQKELEKDTTTDNSEPDILSFDESKRKTFGTVKYGVAKYECYARILEDFANLHGENDTIEEYVDDLRGLFLAWRECAQDDYVFVHLWLQPFDCWNIFTFFEMFRNFRCKRTKWKAAEDHLNAFFFLSGIEDAVSEFFRDIRSKCWW